MWTTLLLTGFLVGAVPTSEVPTGEYVEARTASVFAGACHFNGEYTTQGRRAVLGWSIEAGSELGVDLSGVRVVALVEAQANLADVGPRVSIVHVSATGVVADAALAWLGRTQTESLGVVQHVHVGAAITVDVEGDAFQLALNGDVSLVGDVLANRACCKMPFQVWYESHQPLLARLVGCPTEFTVADRDLGWKFDRAGENNVFFGRFGLAE